MVEDKLIPAFAKALDEYKETYMGARNLAARSRVEYENDILPFLRFLQGLRIRKLNQVASKHIDAYLADLDHRELAGVTRRWKLTVIKTFFAWLKGTDQITVNPAARVIPPHREEKEPRVLSKNEYQRLLATVGKPRDRAIVQLLLQTGVRLSEVRRLTLSDLELPKRVTRKALGTMRILGKGRKTRTVLLNTKACEALDTWLKLRPDVDTDALFVSTHLKPLSGRQIQRLVGKYLRAAGIKGAGVHSLRHTFATHHIEMGTDLVTVQEFLGHSSLDTTKLYVGLVKKRQAQHIQDHAL